MSRVIFLLMIALFFVHHLTGQEIYDKPIDGNILAFGIGMGANLPVGDIKDRYGNNLNFSLGSEYITKNNWIVNGEFLFLFSENVKEDVLAPYRTSTYTILGDDNQVADVFLRQRGLFLGIGLGKLFPFRKDDRSGLKCSIQAGVLQHNIRFTD